MDLPKSKWIVFKEMQTNIDRKTKIIGVLNKSGGYPIGLIKWHSQWRQYCFFPEGNMLFSQGCLEDIIKSISMLMADRR